MKHKQIHEVPQVEQLEKELKREQYKRRYRRTLKSTVYALITVAAVAVLVATLWMPVLEITGGSMAPTLVDGEIVVSLKTSDLETGQVIAFYHNNSILVKRVIAGPGDWVEITEDGTVYVNGARLEEPYVQDKALGICDLEMPYQVPESRIFVMGDHRSTSTDSRSSAVGCIAEDQIVGRLVFRVWPLADFGAIS